MSVGLDASSPERLIPGDPRSLEQSADQLRAWGSALELAAEGLRRIDTSAGWSGKAADQFRRVFDNQPGKWLRAADALRQAASALQQYAMVLTWAQGQASDAITAWNAGAAHHQAARELLDSARSQADSAAYAAAQAIGRARDMAPPRPGLLSEIGDDLEGALSSAWHAGEESVGRIASIGNAVIHDPGAVLESAGGGLLTVASVGGEGLGAVLDATGIGRPAGRALQAVSAAGMATGTGMARDGTARLEDDADGPDHVGPQEPDDADDSGGSEDDRDLEQNPGKIGRETGYPTRQIKDAIHAVKNQRGWRGIGGARNPDVFVDPKTGEVYPETPDGEPADDSIGNIYDYLPEEP